MIGRGFVPTLEYVDHGYPADCLLQLVNITREKEKTVWNKYALEGNTASSEALANKLGFHNRYTARGIVICTKEAESYTMEVAALRVGGLGFATVPYETFCANDMWGKENYPMI